MAALNSGRIEMLLLSLSEIFFSRSFTLACTKACSFSESRVLQICGRLAPGWRLTSSTNWRFTRNSLTSSGR